MEGGPATYGWWPSLWSAAAVAAGKVSRGSLQAAGGALYWSESRPQEGGRQVVVGRVPGRPPTDVSPPGVSVRTRVHEYGGTAYAAADGYLYYSDADDERLYRCETGAPAGPPRRSAAGPVALIPPPPAGVALRFGDLRPTPSGRGILAVEERVEAGVTGHRLVAVATDGSGRVLPVVEGPDFVAAPRPSPDGTLLVWTSWNHPDMPWDAAELHGATFDEDAGRVAVGRPRRLAGGKGGSVGQPGWGQDGALRFVDESSGWWLPVLVPAERVRRFVDDPGSPTEVAGAGLGARPLLEAEAEFHGPDWVLGQSTMADLADGSLVARRRQAGRDALVRLAPADGPEGTAAGWRPEVVEQPCVSIAGVAASGGSVWVLGSTPGASHVVVEVGRPPDHGHAVVVAGGPETDPAAVSPAEPFVAAGPQGPVPGLFFAPANPSVTPPSERPPLVVFCHGGPTGSAEPGFDPVVQYFTSRGLAVAAVDYRGSTGYGRSYRRALEGRWGEADVEDCLAFAEGLADAGRVDGSRMAVRGTSAGGFTALAALVRSDRFLGAAAWYGVTDLEALARDTHAFESRYLDRLVGPLPEAAALYRERSPLHHAAEVSGRVLLLQGAEDPVVLVDQARRFAEELRAAGRDCRLLVFEGEAHGFRRAETVEACLEAELAFYRELFGGR